jgi:hypothetical protein
LREKAKGAKDFQHNILLQMNGSCSYGIYIAPLTLKNDEYYNSLYESNIFSMIHKFMIWFGKMDLFVPRRNIVNYKNCFVELASVPFMKNHISIIPQDKVDTAEHYYSFSKTTDNIYFHSGEKSDHNSGRLADFFFNIYQQLLNSDNFQFDLKQHIKYLIEILNYSNRLKASNDEPSKQLQEIGRYLQSEYQIKQYVIYSFDDYE